MRIQISGGLYASILLIIGTVMQYMLLPSRLVESVGQEAWISVLGGGLYGLVVSFAVVWLACRFPGRDPLAGVTCTVGRWAALPVRLIYAVLNFVNYAVSLHDLRSFASILLLFGTPGWVIVVMVTIVAIYAVLQGLEPIARLAYGSFIPVLLVVLLLPWGLMREFSVLQVDPFLWKGIDGLLDATLLTWPWTGQSIFVLTLLPHLSPQANPYKWTLVGVGGSTLILSVTVALASLIFGSVQPGRMLYPGFELLAIIAVSEAVERIQAAILIVWLAGGLVKIILNLYATVEEVGLAFGIGSRVWTTVLLALAGLVASQPLQGPLQRSGLVDTPGWILLHLGLQWTVILLLGGVTLLARLRQGGSLHG